MKYNISFSALAEKDIKKLDSAIQKALFKKLKYIQEVGDISDIAKKLSNFDGGEYRIRMGDYRVIFDMDKNNMMILRVIHRKDAYK